MTIFDNQYRAVDSLHFEAVDSTTSDDGAIEWNEQTRVTIDEQPWEDAFGTDTFHKAEYTVTKPAEQPYFIDGERVTMTKPRDELKKAQWRLDNLPWTIEHPPSKRVVEIDEARGFWRGPYYDEDADEQRLSLYIPANDDEALQYAADTTGVSVGFSHSLTRPDEYDGEVGGDVNIDNVDALQTDIYYDHVAGTNNPRLPDTGPIAGDALPADVSDERLTAADSGTVGLTAVDERPVSQSLTPHKDDTASVSLSPQATDGSEVTVEMAVAARRYYVCIHTRGDEYLHTSPSLSAAKGIAGPFDANDVQRNLTVPLNQPLAENTEVFATLFYAASGSKAGMLLGQRGFVTDRANVVVSETMHKATSVTATDAKTTQSKRGDEAPRGIYVDDDTWYAVAPSENSDGEPKYPLTSCTGNDSIKAAWNLRAHGEYDIEQSTLADRIQRAADAMDCPLDIAERQTDSTMTDEFELDDLTVDTIAEQNDEVADLVEQRDTYETRVDELEEQKDALEEELDEVRAELDEFKEKQRTEELDQRIDTLTDLTDRWSEDELREMEVDSHDEHIRRLDERIEIYDGMTDPSTPTADSEGDDGDDSEYVTGEVLDLSETA